MIIKAEQYRIITFRINPPVFIPFYNEWGKNAYHTMKPFSYNPFTINASSTSGSPVLISENKFFGFLNDRGGEFSFNGSNALTVTLYEGEELYYNENCNPYEEWKKYNRIISGDVICKQEEFWSRLEYCTWVEQAKIATREGCDNQDVLNEKFVYDYMEKIKKLGLPKGKLTIDDGWAENVTFDGLYSVGNWKINRNKFPNFEKLIEDIKAEGFIPGLWFSPFTFTPDCELAKHHPELIGTAYNTERNWYNIRYDEEILRDYYKNIFSYYASMGFMKFKLDISYGPKNEMIMLLKLMSEEIKNINPKIEIETHMPDIFASQYADTVRINDVSFDPQGNWRYVTSGHYVVCRNSSPNKILNLDHVGTNNPLMSGNNFLEHFEMLKVYSEESGGYVTVSYLPDEFSEKIQKEFVNGLYELYNKDGSRRKK